MEIRSIHKDDLSAVAVLLNDYRKFYGQTDDLNSCEEFLNHRYIANESIIFVAEEAGELIGFVQMYPTFSSVSLKKAYILNDLYVSETARGTGAGSRLIEKCYEFCEANDARYVTLETARDNDKAQSLYEKMGMSKDESVYHYSRTF